MMTVYMLTGPVVIGSRLMPALIIARGTETHGTISAEIDHFDGSRAVIRYVIDYPGGEYERADLSMSPLYADREPGEIVAHALSTICSFLEAEAEAYTGSGNMGTNEPADGWLFNADLAEWAYLNSDEIAMARVEIEGDDS